MSASDPGVDRDVYDVDHQIHDQGEYRGKENESQDWVNVGIQHTLHGILPGTAPTEDNFHQHGTTEQIAVENTDDRNDGGKRIPQSVADNHSVRNSGQHLVTAEIGLQHSVHGGLRHLQDRARVDQA